jgi:tetraacyldisaccharide 4'-kinase
MPDDILLRILLLPVAMLYGLGVTTRNLLYRIGLLRSVRFSMPVISVGNLAIGGTGKSPHIEYLLSWLDQYINVAMLSRGYGRNTIGYQPVTVISTAASVGDEPLQMKRKFSNIPMAVSESRALGVPELVKNNPDTQCVLLDDAFQHLAVQPGLHVMLTEYARPFYNDWLLPSGRLREWRSSYQRADIIVVTKCPPNMTPEQRNQIYHNIAPYPRQQVYFSRYRYGTPYRIGYPGQLRSLDMDTDVLLMSAIANTDYLLDYLSASVRSVRTIEHEDHHYFNEADLSDLRQKYKAIPGHSKIILTTEKDATRLEAHREFLQEMGHIIYVLPVEVEFCDDDESQFQATVQRFLEEFKV